MKISQQMNAHVIGLVLTTVSVALGQTYGPNSCVSINRSQQGTCVIATNCEDGVNLDKLEFAFDCQTKTQIQKHSFGVGGFDSVEEFDTGIKCAQCMVPQNHKVHKVTKKSTVHMFAKRSAANEDALVDKYGPGNCVETFRSTTGTCMVKTQCKDQDINNYDFGLLCVQNTTSGENVRHLFGKNSFDPEEEFDTLIKCEKCLGLKAEATQTAATVVDANVKSEDLVKKVNTLVDEVGAMQAGLETIKDDVKVLNEKVPKLYTTEAKKEGDAKEEGESKEGEAKEGETKDEEKKEGEGKEEEKKEEKKDEDAKESETEEKKAELFLSHHRSKRHTRKKLHQKFQQRHHHKKHHTSDEDEDSDDDKADDEGSDDSSSSQKDSREEDDAQDDDDSKDQDQDQGKDQEQDQEDSDDKKVDEDAKDSEEAN